MWSATRGNSTSKVVFVLRDLAIGGAERAVVRLANFAASQGVDTHLVLLTGTGPLSAEVAREVTVHNLSAKRIRSATLSYWRLLKRLRPEAVMSSLPQVNALTVLVAHCLAPRPRVVLREANDPRKEAPFGRRLAPLVKYFVSLAYRQADRVIAVSQGVRTGLVATYLLPEAMVMALPNVSLDDSVLAKATVPLDDKWYSGLSRRIVCVARLSRQKDHATLLEAFRSLSGGSETGLVLIGSGPLEAEIRKRIDDLGLQQRVKLVTDESNPFRWVKLADVLVLASRWEGSPNVLVEALALGVPVVATDCPSGPREILVDGRFGTLVPIGDAAALTDAIECTLEARPPAALLVDRGMDFHVERVGPAWLAALF